MTKRLAARDVAALLLVVALWGYAFVPIKWALADLPPFLLAALRFFFGAIPVVVFVARPAVPWRELVAYGLAIGVFQFGLLFLGMKLGMSAGLASLVIQVQVFFTMGLGRRAARRSADADERARCGGRAARMGERQRHREAHGVALSIRRLRGRDCRRSARCSCSPGLR